MHSAIIRCTSASVGRVTPSSSFFSKIAIVDPWVDRKFSACVSCQLYETKWLKSNRYLL